MTLRFLLNDAECVTDAGPLTPALDFLRDHAGLTAAKAGCREGGCGACSVLLGEVRGGQALRYRVVNSCLLPMAALAGRHLVTVEGLSETVNEGLNPVQQALVDQGAIQCGFCTPGLVIALTGYLLDGDLRQEDAALEALDGNLCRCTGYAGIRRAATAITECYRDALPSPEPEPIVRALTDAGATRILYPRPMPGVTVTPLKTAEDRKTAEQELEQRAQQEDFHG